MSVKRLDAESFRRSLAGLCDQAEDDEMNDDDYRELASQVGMLLYIAYNMRRLDPKNIHNRVQSAIAKGLADCDAEDASQFLASALEHVQANVNLITTQSDCVGIQGSIYSLSRPQQIHLLRYLSKHKMPAQVWGCERWKDRKEELVKEKAMLEIEEAKQEELAQ